MKIIDNLGYMQGRLTPTKNGIIQSFPEKNWDKEFKLANSLGLRYMEWTLDYKNLFKNVIQSTPTNNCNEEKESHGTNHS